MVFPANILVHMISLRCHCAKRAMNASQLAGGVSLWNRLGPMGLHGAQCEAVRVELAKPDLIPV